jgi:hypothetical protein
LVAVPDRSVTRLALVSKDVVAECRKSTITRAEIGSIVLIAISMSDTTKTLIVAVAGIVVSGVVGPSATAWATRRANRQQFERDQRAKRRDDFRALVDHAAELLGAGVTSLRVGREAKAAGSDEPDEVKEWASAVHLLRQRLLLRSARTDDVMTSYADVLDALEAVGTATTDGDYTKAVQTYKEKMDRFLATARASLESPVS